jgi:hypothetical protein
MFGFDDLTKVSPHADVLHIVPARTPHRRRWRAKKTARAGSPARACLVEHSDHVTPSTTAMDGRVPPSN